MLKYILLSSTILLSSSVYATSTLSEATEAAEGQKRISQTSEDRVKNYIKYLQDSYKGLSSEEDAKKRVTHDEKLIPVIEAWKLYFNTFKPEDAEYEPAQYLMKEMQEYQDNQRVNYEWAQTILLRFAAAISTPSEDEKEVFQHVLNTGRYDGFFEKDLWKDPIRFYQAIKNSKDHSHFNCSSHTTSYLYSDFVKTVKKKVGSYFLPHSFLPLPGVTYFAREEMVDLSFDNTYMLALSPLKDKRRAHGIDNASVFGHLFHDVFHGHFDSKKTSFQQYVVQTVDRAVGEGVPAGKMTDLFVPLAIDRYHNAMFLFKAIFSGLGDKYKEDKTTYEKLLNALFFTIHEYPAWSKEIFDHDVAATVVKTFVQNAQNVLNHREMWESEEDPFNTSPQDGSTTMTDDEIIKAYTENLIQQKSMTGPEDVEFTKLTRSKRFIYTEIHLNNGGNFKISYATLHQKLLNAADAVGRIALTGTKIHLPDSTTATSDATIAALRAVKDELRTHLSLFQEEALKLMEEAASQGEASFVSIFEKNNREVTGKIEDIKNTHKKGAPKQPQLLETIERMQEEQNQMRDDMMANFQKMEAERAKMFKEMNQKTDQ